MVDFSIKSIGPSVFKSLLIEDLEIIRCDKFYLSYLSSIQLLSYREVYKVFIIYKNLYRKLRFFEIYLLFLEYGHDS
jgi:hypothetical protein